MPFNLRTELSTTLSVAHERVRARTRDSAQAFQDARGLSGDLTFPLNVWAGVIACTNYVVAAPEAKRRLLNRNGKFLAVEMESAAVAYALNLSPEPRPGLVVIRGISDMADRDKSATDGGALPDGSVATAPGLYRWVAASHAALLLELMVVNGLVGIGAPPEDYVDSFSPKNEDKTLQDFEDTIQITVPESKEFGAGAFDRRREIEFQSFIEIFHRLLGSGLMRVDELVQRTIEHQINQQAYLFAESTRLDSDRIRRLVEQSKKRGYLIEKGPWLSVPLDYRRQ